MHNKIARLSYGQLVLLNWFLGHPKSYGTVEQLEKNTPLKSKSLGGVLSSLSRTKFRGISLIEPYGKATHGGGLRWKLSRAIGDITKTKREVRRMLATYK